MRNVNSHAYEYDYLKNFTPLLHYDGSVSVEDWKARAFDQLNHLLGLPFEDCDPCVHIEYTADFDDFTEIRFMVQTELDYFVPCHLLIPKNVALPAPLTLSLSGHGGGMHVSLGRIKQDADREALESWFHRATALRAVREGRCALVLEARNFGESSLNGYGTSCTEAGKIALLMGRTIIGERVWDAMRVLDVVGEQFAQVDMSNILCTGNSGGGTATFYLACLDERITVAAPCCSVCTYEDSIAAMPHCLCNHIPSIRKYFEMGDLAGLIAPRRLIVAAGAQDSIFPLFGVKRAYKQIEFIYESAGCPERCALVVGDKGHLNYADLIYEKFYQMTE